MQGAATDTSSHLGEAARLTNCKEEVSKGVGVSARLCVRKGERELVREKAAEGQEEKTVQGGS